MLRHPTQRAHSNPALWDHLDDDWDREKLCPQLRGHPPSQASGSILTRVIPGTVPEGFKNTPPHCKAHSNGSFSPRHRDLVLTVSESLRFLPPLSFFPDHGRGTFLLRSRDHQPKPQGPETGAWKRTGRVRGGGLESYALKHSPCGACWCVRSNVGSGFQRDRGTPENGRKLPGTLPPHLPPPGPAHTCTVELPVSVQVLLPPLQHFQKDPGVPSIVPSST